ncbi:MAG: hypothetical protein H7A33_04860 [Deltaproteobacteria bacterium]|nr:hypothetical protein [Deltaproteobacteria bacterium]
MTQQLKLAYIFLVCGIFDAFILPRIFQPLVTEEIMSMMAIPFLGSAFVVFALGFYFSLRQVITEMRDGDNWVFWARVQIKTMIAFALNGFIFGLMVILGIIALLAM